MIDFTFNREGFDANVKKAREQKIIIPTIAQMKDPSLIPEKIRDGLKNTGMQDIDPLNLFRISWKNEKKDKGGLFNEVPNYIELPHELTGVKARILAMPGKWFPTNCHKVGASFGCLAPRLVTGRFNVEKHKSVWPSTGNYCRGGAFNARLLGAVGVAVLPEEMSQERFDWLASVGAEVIKTPGGEANVAAIFEQTNRMSKDPQYHILNQFADMGNVMWHYNVSGNAMAEVFEAAKGEKDRFAGVALCSGSSGIISAGDRVKDLYPKAKLAAGEALQCPTMLNNGYGSHRIEGIGDRHIPWIHNVKNTDMVIDIDDEDSQRLLRLFNCKEGQEYLTAEFGFTDEQITEFTWMGISGIANVLCCIKMAKYYELDEHDVLVTVLTDSAAMYQSRVEELNAEFGPYSREEARLDHELHMLGQKTDNMEELSYRGRRRLHNLKYYTWVEQQGKSVEELNALWYDTENTWEATHKASDKLDEYINEFNEATGLLK